MSHKLSVDFLHHVVGADIEFEFESPADLDAFQRFVLKILDIRPSSKEDILVLAPFPKKILDLVLLSLTEKELKLISVTNNIFKLTQSGKSFLADGKVSRVYTFRQKFFFDPISKTFMNKVFNAKFHPSLRDHSTKIFNQQMPQDFTDFKFIDSVISSLPIPKDERDLTLTRATLCGTPFDKAISLTYLLDRTDGRMIEKIVSDKHDFTTHFDYLLDESSRDHIPEKLQEVTSQRSDFIFEFLKTLDLGHAVTSDEMTREEDPTRILGYLVDREHPVKLLELMGQAKNRILISSGWVGTVLINSKSRFMRELITTLERSVDVHLFFIGQHAESKDTELESIYLLEEMKKKYSNLHLHYQNKLWHRKIVLVDNNVSIVGSYNWLSNSGDKSGESSTIIQSHATNTHWWTQYLNSSFALKEGDLPPLFVTRKICELDWDKLKLAMEENEPIEGVITRQNSGGFIVDIGIDAFVPLSLFSFDFINDGSEFIGQKMSFHIHEIDPDRKGVKLSRKSVIRQERLNIVKELEQAAEMGTWMDGVVEKVMNQGVNIRLSNKLQGYLASSQIEAGITIVPFSVFEIGDEIQVRLLSIEGDVEGVNIQLSLIKAAGIRKLA